MRQRVELAGDGGGDDLGVGEGVDDGADLDPEDGAAAVVRLEGGQLLEGVLVAVAHHLRGEPEKETKRSYREGDLKMFRVESL